MTQDITIRFLEPEEYSKINHFFDNEGVPRLDPNWSKVVAALTPEGEVVGIMCLQLVAHAEPIVIKPDFRKQGLSDQMAQMLDGYVMGVGLPGLYTQPTNPLAVAICEKMGFEPSDHPLYVKVYDGRYESLMPTGEN